jgi:hypothetical protein
VAEGVARGFFMGGRFLGGCQRFYWEIEYGRHSRGYWRHILPGCKIIRL